MFKYVKIDGSSRHNNVTYNFGTGVTSISGANESGKSQLLEYMTFGLFGSAALRGNAEDYGNLKVELGFSIRGKDYVVERSIKSAKLYEVQNSLFSPIKTLITNGVKAVNTKVPQLLGYGLNVYQMSNIAKQGEIDSLGKMRPAERKAAVDALIGINHLDTISKRYTEMANSEEKTANTLSGYLTEPVEPTAPNNYVPSETLKDKLKVLEDLKRKESELVGWLSRGETRPDDIGECPTHLSLESLELKQKARELALATPKPSYTKDELQELEHQLSDYALWEEYNRLPKEPYPNMTVDEIHEVLASWTKYDIRTNWEKGAVACPKCAHSFNPYSEEPEAVPEPKVTREECNHQLKLISIWGDKKPWIGTVPKMTAVPKLTADQIAKQRELLELPVVEIPEDVSEIITNLKVWESKKQNYLSAMSRYNQWCLEAKAKTEELVVIREELRLGSNLPNIYQEAIMYEHRLSQYADSIAQYNKIKLDIEQKRALVDKYRAVSKAVPKIKARIKQHLTPALSTVASRLIYNMSGGLRSKVIVDEDFNITVDGEPLNWLSGSAQSIANLALRIGLGQVLTHKVFSVFIGDEIDASMDESRSANTAETLKNLSKQLAQVILVSHKEIAADAYIKL